MEALLLDPNHVRNNTYNLEDSVKAAIQRDAAECFLQLALFEPGREMLLTEKGGASAMEALRALADGNTGCLAVETKECAHGALMAVEGRTDPERYPPGSTKQSQAHIMMSYQWDVSDLCPLFKFLTQIQFDLC
jgi:hypothetical protein